ncbi:MAG: YbaB/EbfC family nucleoid-associated protein [Bacteroidetes bacterium]|nr:YbaB/EbfC family nucleoid-associated protein [Bacteroidota bacterium]
MFGKFGDMLGKINEIKQKVEEIKTKLESSTVQASSATGDVKITMNGNRKVKQLSIAPSLQSASKEELERQLMAVFNQAVEAAEKLSAEEMKKVAGGLIPPGLL